MNDHLSKSEVQPTGRHVGAFVDTIDQDPLYTWVTQMFGNVCGGHKPATLTLAHLDVGDRPQALNRWDLKSHTDQYARQIVASIQVEARDNAMVHGGLEKYMVLFTWPMGEQVTRLFQIDGAMDRSGKGAAGASYPATTEGTLKLMATHSKELMNHVQVLMRISTSAALEQQARQEQTITRLETRVDSMEAKRFQVLETAEQLMDARAEREAQALRDKASEQRKEAAFKEAMAILPLVRTKVIEKFTGMKLSAESPAQERFRALFGSLNEGQFAQLLGILEGDQAMLFIDSYKEMVLSPQERAAAARQKALDAAKAASEAAAAAAAAETAAAAAPQLAPAAEPAAEPAPPTKVSTPPKGGETKH